MSTIEEKLEEMSRNLQEKNKQPIFFIGSGLSRRYLETPDWEGLLNKIAIETNCDYQEIKNQCDGEYEKIAQELEYYCFREAKFDSTGYQNHRKILRKKIADIFIKCSDKQIKQMDIEKKEEINKRITNQLDNIENIYETSSPTSIQHYAEEYNRIAEDINSYSDECRKIIEIQELKKINPKAIITTNYDTLLEDIIFKNNCNKHVGQEGFLSSPANSENKIDLYKIHGCVTRPDSIIITKEDYDDFFLKSKYLYSKLLTMFWEYPLIFIGYSISDRNIKDILTVMIEVMTDEQINEFLNYIWVIDYVKDENKQRVVSKKVELLNGKSIEVTCFQLKYYEKFFEAISKVVLNQKFGDLKFTISDNVIELLIKPLYQQQDKLRVVTRELLQNALDACKKKGSHVQIRIKLFEEEGNQFLEVSDNGIGMNLQMIRENFLTVGKTDKKDNQKGLVGKYGVGILSIFLIGDYAEVFTKKADSIILSLKLYIKDDKKQVSWLDSVPETIKNSHDESFTTVKIRLNNNFHIEKEKNIKYYMNLMGLETYIAKPENSIVIECMDKRVAIIKANKPEWFSDLTSDIHLYKSKWLDVDELSEEEKELKHVLDINNIILYNDMVSVAKFNKTEFKQLNGIDIPFVIINVKNVNDAEEEIKTDLSRSNIQISGRVMQVIARGIYELEIKKMVELVNNSVTGLENHDMDIYDVIKQIRNSCTIVSRNIDILINQNKLFFSNTKYLEHIEVWGDEITAKNMLDNTKEPALYYGYTMRKTFVSDKVSDEKLICISVNYLDEYIYNANNPSSGLKKDALVKILHFLGIEDVKTYNSSTEIWEYIKANKKNIRAAYIQRAKNNIIWFDDYHNSDIEVGGGYFIAFKSEVLEKYLDNDFYEILQKDINEKSLNNIIQM